MSAMKNGEEKIEPPFGRSVPAMDSNMIDTMMATAKRAEVSSRRATFIVVRCACRFSALDVEETLTLSVYRLLCLVTRERS